MPIWNQTLKDPYLFDFLTQGSGVHERELETGLIAHLEKCGDFKPEYAGKMSFYCSVVDDRLRHETDKPTIGLILCQQPNRLLAEYALRGVDSPIGVSGFELTRALPENLQTSLPSIEQIESELGDFAQ